MEIERKGKRDGGRLSRRGQEGGKVCKSDGQKK